VAENCNPNNRGAKERGKKNVFARIRNNIRRDIIGTGYAVVHSAVQGAADCPPVDMEIDVSKMHEHFHKNTAYVQTQKDF
jgi:hypothetical protein